MDLGKLKDAIRTLVTLEESAAPLLSLYVNLEKGREGYRGELDRRVRREGRSLDVRGQARPATPAGARRVLQQVAPD